MNSERYHIIAENRILMPSLTRALLLTPDMRRQESVSICKLNKEHETLVEDFERQYMYSQCFKTACNINIVSMSRDCDICLIAIANNECVGCIIALHPKKIDMDAQCENCKYRPEATIIINFCVRKEFRSFNVGTRLLRACIGELQNKKRYISINTQEPLNDTNKLYAFYEKFGFREYARIDNYIFMKS